MRFARLHPTFIFLVVISLLGIAGAFVLSIASSSACNQLTQPDERCVIQAQAQENSAVVVAIGSLTLMVGGVGFQIGRAGPGGS